ncbi:MAG: hypothetical protein IPH88_03240 [Bacteroidales bacterium]|nr:hypothetical protein [Bacteroidales bacterium]
MKMFKKITNFLPLFTLVLVTMLVVSCKKDKDETQTAPALPPQSGFVMNFTDFSSADTLKSAAQVDTYGNYGYSYLNVAFWNSVLTANLAIPVASYIEAFKHEAVYHPENSNWTWSYNFTVGFSTYLAELTGKVDGTNIDWEMLITKSGDYTDFQWYRGRSAVDQSGGYWILAENPQNANDYLRIDWKKYSDGTEDIKYSYIKAGEAENGSYIWYGTALTTFDRFYQIYRKPTNNHTNIEWSSTQKNGHVKDPLHYGDNAWHCWGVDLKDTVCE